MILSWTVYVASQPSHLDWEPPKAFDELDAAKNWAYNHYHELEDQASPSEEVSVVILTPDGHIYCQLRRAEMYLFIDRYFPNDIYPRVTRYN